jgi:hypothetical protein
MSPMNLEDFEKALERRKAALGLTGYDYVLPNSGVNRTLEKRALLRAIADAAAERGVEPPIKANF